MSKPVFSLAREIAEAQDGLGMSPAEERSDGTLLLCAASCVAVAALAVAEDEVGLAEFAKRIWTDDKEVLLPAVFERCGLRGSTAVELLRENDQRPPIARLNWFRHAMGQAMQGR